MQDGTIRISRQMCTGCAMQTGDRYRIGSMSRAFQSSKAYQKECQGRIMGKLQWQDVVYEVPNVTDQKILIIGLGGGCDILSAYAMAQMFPPSEARLLVYGNTKHHDEPDLETVGAWIRQVPGEAISPSELSGHTHGSTLIDRSVPRGDEGCPWIFLLPKRREEKQLQDAIASMGFDLIYGIDTGGDSMATDASSGSSGRDKRMLRLLQRIDVPFLHVVVAPGCDGESEQDDLGNALELRIAQAEYRGCFSLEPFVPVYRALSATLKKRRTPGIILSAFDNQLEVVHNQVKVPRGCKPWVPCDWLTQAWVFQYGPKDS